MELKCPLTIDQQLEKLKSHNIIIDDMDEARNFLQQVSYYRITGYILQFRESPSNSDIVLGHKLSEIQKLYVFDAELRSLL